MAKKETHETGLHRSMAEIRPVLEDAEKVVAERASLEADSERIRLAAKANRTELVTATLDGRLGDKTAQAKADDLRVEAASKAVEAEVLEQAGQELEENRFPNEFQRLAEVSGALERAVGAYVRGEAHRLASELGKAMEVLWPLLVQAYALQRAAPLHGDQVGEALGTFGFLMDDAMDERLESDRAAQKVAAPVAEAIALLSQLQAVRQELEPAWRARIAREREAYRREHKVDGEPPQSYPVRGFRPTLTSS